MATTLAEHISLEKTDDGYISTHLPQRMGNSAPIAYGGYAIGLAIHAACKSAPEGFHLYSAFGNFLRAVSTEAKLTCKTVELRKSKSFVTYRVSVEQQVGPSGEFLLCMEVTTDFHKDESSILSHSAAPSRTYSNWKDCMTWDRIIEDQVKSGKVTERQSKAFFKLFGLSGGLYEGRPCPEGVSSQNLIGLAKTIKTSQDELSPTAKSSADWFRVKHPLRTEAEQMAGLGFIMDGLLSFLPLAHNHLFFDDVGACSSLDFALRIFTPRLAINGWHLREAINHRAGSGRTFSESKLWDEEGNMVACMSQQSILRVPAKTAKI